MIHPRGGRAKGPDPREGADMADGKRRLGLLLESRLPATVLVGAALLGIVSNGLYELLRDRLGGPLITLTAGVLLIVIIVLVVEPLARVRAWIRTRLRTSAEIRGDVRRRKGLIALVSPEHAGGRQAVDEALAYHCMDEGKNQVLRWCCLIAGPGAGDPAQRMVSSREKAERLQKELEGKGITARVIWIDSEEKGGDPLTTMALVERAFSEAAHAGLGPEDVIADYTGGTKTMTAGMILACARPDRKLEFMKPRAYKPDGTADRAAGSEPREVDIAFTLLPAEDSGAGS